MKSWESQWKSTCSASHLRLGFEDVDMQTAPGENHRSGQAIGPCTDYARSSLRCIGHVITRVAQCQATRSLSIFRRLHAPESARIDLTFFVSTIIPGCVSRPLT